MFNPSSDVSVCEPIVHSVADLLAMAYHIGRNGFDDMEGGRRAPLASG